MPSSSPEDVVELRLPRHYLVALLAAAAFLVVFAVLVAYSLVHQLQTIEDTDRKIQGLNRSIQPVLRDARDRLPAVRDQAERTRELLRTAQPLAEDARPLVRELDALIAELGDRALLRDAEVAAERTARGIPQLVALQRRTLATQRETLLINKRLYLVTRSTRAETRRAVVETRAAVRATREILGLTRPIRSDAKRAADAAERIDRRLGGLPGLPTSAGAGR